MNNPTQYQKTKLGHMMDARRAMGEVAMITAHWCKAFDVGDFKAVGDLSNDLTMCFKEFCAAIAAVEKAPSE